MSIKKTIIWFGEITFMKSGREIKKDGFVILLCDKYGAHGVIKDDESHISCLFKRIEVIMTAENEVRQGAVNRATSETDIKLAFTLDGTGQTTVSTGVAFFDHMLTLFGVHGFFDLDVAASGDIDVDYHHTVEDVGICLGQALAKALGDRAGISRYGVSYLPMDETLVRVVVDVSNRPYLHYDAVAPDQKVGSFDTCLAKEFMRAFSQHAGLTLHVDLLHGENSHHIIEAVFKALGRSVNDATRRISGMTTVLSSKGSL